MVKENIDTIYAKNMRPQCWGEPHSGCTYYRCRSTSRLTTSPPLGRNSSKTVPVSSLCLAAGWGTEEDPLVELVRGCPARFMFHPIANAVAA